MHSPLRRTLTLVVAVCTLFGIMAIPTMAGANPDPKVYVCKYVGTPGVNETLQTGQNPIEVSQNALQGDGFDGTFPFEFSDAQGRSVAIGFVGGPVLTIEDCPAPEVEEEVKDMRVDVDPGDCDNPNAVITLDNTRTQNTGNNPITITIEKDGVEVFKEDIADGDFVVLTVAGYSFLRTEVGESDTFVVTHGPKVLGEGTTNRLNCEPGDAVLSPAASIEANCDEATVVLDNSASVDGDEVDATVTFEVFINDGEASTVEVDAGESAVLPIVGLSDGDAITVSALDAELASATVSIDDGCVSVEDEPPTNPNPPGSPGVNELPETL